MPRFFILFPLFFIFSCKQGNFSDKDVAQNSYYDKAFVFLKKDNLDSAYINFNKAKDVYLFIGDSLHVAKCHINMAIIESDKGDFFGSQESALRAISFLNEQNNNQFYDICSSYNTLGIATQNIKDYAKATKFYKKALEFSTDSTNRRTNLNNLATAYRDLKKYDSAISILKGLLNDAVQDNEITYSRILDNYAYTRFLQNPSQNAEPKLNQALQIREKSKDLWGQNASHAHLSDYFIKKDFQKSLFHAHKMYEIASSLDSPDDRLEALQKLILLENAKNSKKYFLQYQKLNDSLQTARNKSKNQFALIRYETEKSKAENEKLKADSAYNANKILRRNIVVGVLITTLLSAIFWYRKRQKIQEQKEQINIKNTKLKISKKVHDVVANGLYQTMVEIQNQPEFNKEKVLNEIEKLYEESRDIAQDDSTEIPDKEFSAKLYQMISSYHTDSQKIYIVGNSPELWERVPPHIQSEIYYVVREFLVNMKKHSHAKLISLKFEKKQDALKIKYTDNGIGINNLETKKGSGIQNTENRIATIGGEINFEKNPKGGLMINIVIPIH